MIAEKVKGRLHTVSLRHHLCGSQQVAEVLPFKQGYSRSSMGLLSSLARAQES